MPLLIDIRSSIKRIEDREGRDGFDERALQQAVQSAIREQLGARSAHGQGTLRDVIEAKVSTGSDAAAPANGPGTAGRVMFRLGRVRFDMLEEEDEVLGEGTFGVVHSGTYMGEEVAIKKARGPVGEQSVLREFRWVLSSQSFGMEHILSEHGRQWEATVVSPAPRLGPVAYFNETRSVASLKRKQVQHAANFKSPRPRGKTPLSHSLLLSLSPPRFYLHVVGNLNVASSVTRRTFKVTSWPLLLCPEEKSLLFARLVSDCYLRGDDKPR